jgi:pSer/pThr/pTyr-binding forkhead associated (FHA) protein
MLGDVERDVVEGKAADERRRTKRCPRCGQLLFADMQTCYGCLYDFSRDHSGVSLPQPEGSFASVEGRPDTGRGSTQSGSAQRSAAPRAAAPRDIFDDIEEPPSLQVTVLADDSANVAGASLQTSTTTGDIVLFVRTGDVDVTLPVPPRGLKVGRSASNDIVLHAKAVSREHIIVLPAKAGIVVRDLGSTNPPLLHGRPIVGAQVIPLGERVILCGSTLEPRLTSSVPTSQPTP